jgi:hypothetical protein
VRQRVESRQGFGKSCEQLHLGAARVMRPTRGGDGADIRGGAVERRAQRLEVPQAGRTREQARVGDGVGGAREQVGEADGFAQVAGKDTE